LRETEGIWIIPEEKNVSVLYSVHFLSEADVALCKLMLIEISEARVNGGPMVYRPHDSEKPNGVKKHFDKSKLANAKTNNGFI